MTIAEHLDELRKRLVRSSVALALVFGVSWFYVDELMVILERPHLQAMTALQRSIDRKLAETLLGTPLEAGLANYEEKLPREELRAQFRLKREVVDTRLLATSYTAPMMTYMKACLIMALLFAGPYVLWEIWGFIAAGLYAKEKRFVHRYFPLALFLFFGGIAFGYFLMIPTSMEFLALVGGGSIRFQPTIDEYFGFFSTLTFILGLLFQIPLVMLVLSRIGVVGPGSFSGKRKYVIVGAFVVSAIVTPTTDPYTQTILAVSIWLLYELGILLAKIAHRDRQKQMEGTQA